MRHEREQGPQDLAQILQKAVLDGIIAKNPCYDLKGPSKDIIEKEPLIAKQTAQFRAMFDENEPTAKLVAYRLALFAGLRRGEICALKWRDFNAGEGTTTVSQSINEVKRRFKSTKTEAGERTIPLDAGTVDYLKPYKAIAPSACYCSASPSRTPASQRRSRKTATSCTRPTSHIRSRSSQ